MHTLSNKHTSAKPISGRSALESARLPAVFDALSDLLNKLKVESPKTPQRPLPATLQAKLSKALNTIGVFQTESPTVISDLSEVLQFQQAAAAKLSDLSKVTFSKAAAKRAAPKVKPEDLLIISKDSKVQFDKRRFNLTDQELLTKYQAEGADHKRIFVSHRRQLHALNHLQKKLKESTFLHRGTSEAKLQSAIGKAKLVVALGGDNHFQYAASLIRGQQILLGVNSDPKTSFGALLKSSTADLLQNLQKLAGGKYLLEPWSRLAVKVNGKTAGRALCDVFLGQRERPYMSRHVLELDGESIEQKSSGLLVATGAGSGGWYQSAGRFIYPAGNRFSPTARFARFLNTEVSATVAGRTTKTQSAQLPPGTEGVLLAGSKLTIHSLNDRDGILILDSLQEVPFPRGSTATIEIDQEPLWIVKWQH